MTLETSTDNLNLANFGERIIGARINVERERSLVGGVVVGVEPVLAQHDRVGWNAANPRSSRARYQAIWGSVGR